MSSFRTAKALRLPASQISRQGSRSIANAAFNMAKKMMPKISETERVALGCGTVGFDKDIFTGSPSLKHLVDTYTPHLTKEEQSFLDTEVETLCGMIDDYSIINDGDLSPEIWQYIREKGFCAIKIPKEWGGKGFSTQAVSTILMKIGCKSSDVGATVAVPNSLGPGELLVRYGTQEQQEYFLPRLASGQLIPCFGLTGPHSGSDATSLIGSSGVVEERDGVLGIRASFQKRYITLAPVAGVVGIGIDLKDPNNLLKNHGNTGFTVALLERNHEGLRMGPRHSPLVSAFMNGTVEGDDVWIPMDSILGGQEKCGFGWHMFVECLAEGRGVSLPAGSVTASRLLSSATGAYTRVRKQFKVPIAEFGGIQEAMARIGSQGLICISGAELMNCIIDNHEAPMVISSIMKQSCTDRGRNIVIDSMDVLAGAGISRGPSNFISSMWLSMPIAITVEGANIMTRSFQIMGQGITRCHPHMSTLINSLQSEDKDAPIIFRNQLFKVLNHGITNLGQSFYRGLKSTFTTSLRSQNSYKNGNNLVSYHEQQLLRLSANLALSADLALLCGGRLKFEELLLGRLSDVISAIFLGHAVLWHYEKHRNEVGEGEGFEAATEHAMLTLEYEAQKALSEAASNFPAPLGKLGGFILHSTLATGFVGSYSLPGDALTQELSSKLTNPSKLRSLFEKNVYISDQEGDRVGDLLKALPIVCEADDIQAKLRKEKRNPSDEETHILNKAEKIRDALIQVDVFDRVGKLETSNPNHVRHALSQTEAWPGANEPTFNERMKK